MQSEEFDIDVYFNQQKIRSIVNQIIALPALNTEKIPDDLLPITEEESKFIDEWLENPSGDEFQFFEFNQLNDIDWDLPEAVDQIP